MKIIISVDSLSNKMTGIGRYTWELVQGLKASPEIDELLYFSRFRFVRDVVRPVSHNGKAPPARRGPLFRASRSIFQLASPIVQAFQFCAFSGWIYHSPNFYLPNFPGRRLATIHDLSILRFPEYHPNDRVVHLSKEIPKAIEKADLIITDSIYIRREILERFRASPSKIIAIPLSCDGNFRPRGSEESGPRVSIFGLEYGMYALFVGTIEPRKNLSNLIEAYGRLPEDLRSRYPLALVGHSGWKSGPIHEKIRRAEEEGWLRYLGYIDEDILPHLYSGARCFLLPSRYEGFGLPILEAMASGIPVLTSPDSAMEEVAGGAARYCAPDDLESMCRVIAALLSDEPLRNELIRISLQRAKEFSWEKTVAETIAAYRLVAC
jgi:alpha-1,3-rhamnosyl/mannosyltransferase